MGLLLFEVLYFFPHLVDNLRETRLHWHWRNSSKEVSLGTPSVFSLPSQDACAVTLGPVSSSGDPGESPYLRDAR